jgi:hypothetical protein
VLAFADHVEYLTKDSQGYHIITYKNHGWLTCMNQKGQDTARTVKLLEFQNLETSYV